MAIGNFLVPAVMPQGWRSAIERGATGYTPYMGGFLPIGSQPVMPNQTMLSPFTDFGPGGPFTNPLAPSSGPGSMPPPLLPTGGGGSGLVPALGQAACQLITNPGLRAACMAVAGFLPNPGGTGSGPQGGGGGVSNCPAGYKPDGKGGCQLEGVAPYIPGDVGRPDTGWTPVAGMYGMGASPIPVQQTVRACPPGYVLGMDGVCYDHLERRFRAHKPGRKPMLTGGDLNALSRARQLQKSIGKLNTRFGPKKRGCGCKPKGKR